MRPQPWTPKPIPTLWLDYATGAGVTDDGRRVQATPGERRQKPNLTDKLDLAGRVGAARIMFTGDVPKHEEGRRHWLLVQTGKWTPGDHWLGTWRSVTGRYDHELTGQHVDVKVAAEWFGDVELTPDEARLSWDVTAAALRQADERAAMFLSPTATGTNLWAASLPTNVDPVLIEDDIADEIRFTSGQHHVEHMVEGPDLINHPDVMPLIRADRATIPTFAYVDGRFMYASLCRELGIGPAIRLNRAKAFEMLESEPFARARYHVRFKVPENWDHIGILALKDPTTLDRWFYPNRPGATGETWADASEIYVALKAGWMIDPLEAILFTTQTIGRKKDNTMGPVKARPLDTFAERMVRARERVQMHPGLPDTIRAAVAAALRGVILQAIGGFHATGRAITKVVPTALDVPAAYQDSMKEHGDVVSFRIPAPKVSDRNKAFQHPEFSVQIWGRARAKLLTGRAANGHTAGVLTLNPRSVIGVYGDAVYTTEVPLWSLPVDQGGGDDGQVGRLRLQGVVNGRLTLPDTLERRDRLRTRAVKAGIGGAVVEEKAS